MFRISQNQLYSQYLNGMNSSLSNLLESNLQAQTQKRVNKPSDDPTATARIMDHRDTLHAYDQYSTNLDTAKGWLSMSDSTLSQVSTIITRAKELAEQASTGTMSADNRQQISYEARQLFDQLLELSNMTYEDKSIYAGQKTNANAFREVLWMTTNDTSLTSDNTFQIDGFSKQTTLVQFTDASGATASGGSINMSDPNTRVRYSIDGGRTFLTDGSVTQDANGKVLLTLPKSGASVTFAHDAQVRVTDTANTNDSKGSWLWLRPSAVYQGDDADSIKVSSMGTGTQNISAVASGAFTGNTLVRIDNTATLNQAINYSYSMDNGLSWVTGNTVAADSTASNAMLNVAGGGVLTLNSNGGNQLTAGSQFLVTPRTAAITLQVNISESVRINDVGKDIFGGIYQDPDLVGGNGGERLSLTSSNSSAVFSGNSMNFSASNGGIVSKNLFETMGNLVAFLETNTQSGVQQCLESLKISQQQVLTSVASVGGRENRLSITQNILANLTLNENERISAEEDIDIGELMTKLTQQQTVYQAVLKSSSMIMQMNLMQYI
ncbi:MAG: flagellar hook-associated protein 3 [Deltaproteobacteria bacterium HGW-Deltaproteobacteria-8]|jgi:flagellar hook-associated protein 3 FlgL|nr:MAG: flagellar hook-associated protein 3 [Deltaproteobacteria bacterium HGW-Deltaproteobacteria-8]